MGEQEIEPRLSQAKAVLDEKETLIEQKVEEFFESNDQKIESWEAKATGAVASAAAYVLAEGARAANSGTGVAVENVVENVGESAKEFVDSTEGVIQEIEDRVLVQALNTIDGFETKAVLVVEQAEDATSRKIDQCEEAISGAIDAAVSKVNDLLGRLKCC